MSKMKHKQFSVFYLISIPLNDSDTYSGLVVVCYGNVMATQKTESTHKVQNNSKLVKMTQPRL